MIYARTGDEPDNTGNRPRMRKRRLKYGWHFWSFLQHDGGFIGESRYVYGDHATQSIQEIRKALGQ